jgi:hypothetical protein
MPGPYYFGWCEEATPFDEAMLVEDEAIFDLDITQNEGEFAALTIEVANPYIGLLGPGRKQWCWLGWFDGVSVVALFHGRLYGAPDRLTDEVVRLLFVGQPSDYIARKAALAGELRVLPYWDPVWLEQNADDPDTVLEARSALWHTDRVSHELTISDVIDGEDGTIDVSEHDHFYDGVEVSFGGTPKRRITVTATITFTQQATGEVDLTAPLVLAFQAAGSPYAFPLVGSYTADGLLTDWPKPNASLSGGWEMSLNSSAFAASEVPSFPFAVRYTDKSDSTSIFGFDTLDALGNSIPGALAHDFFINWKNFDVVFEISPIRTSFVCSYTAERKRSEIASFTLGASVQSILTDPAGSDEETLTFNSTFVDQPVDEDGALPIGDPRRNLYFATARGQLSLQFLMLVSRAKLRMSARAVKIKFEGTWEKFAEAVSCRKNVLLHDRRLPGGQAAGKIISYRLVASGDGNNFVEVEIGCSIGYGIVLPAAAEGVDTYADGYSRDYTARTGGEVAVIPGELHYDDLAGSYVVDDDGVNLFDMTPPTVIKTLTVTDGVTEQDNAIRFALAYPGEVPEFHTTITADINGTAVTNIRNPEGLVAGVQYLALLAGMPHPSTSNITNDMAVYGIADSPTFFTFNGTAGGTLSQQLRSNAMTEAAAKARGGDATKGRQIDLSTKGANQRGLVPDPIGTLGKHPTIVNLELVPVTGGEFQTAYAIAVSDLVIPKTIDLEAA